MLNYLKNLNPEIEINSIFDELFLNYGKVISGYDFSECINVMEHRSIPESGNTYVARDEELMNTAAAKDLYKNFYGSTPIQIGYCNGNSNKLNALEYHKCSEIDIAVTDLVLILGDLRQIRNNQLSSSDTKIFYVPGKTAIELYSTTLHFAPCKVSDNGFKSIIVLTEGTNQPLSQLPSPKNDEDRLLWMQNKWLIAHKESIPASNGACAGILGDNIEIKYTK
jgi:hypothetical protein